MIFKIKEVANVSFLALAEYGILSSEKKLGPFRLSSPIVLDMLVQLPALLELRHDHADCEDDEQEEGVDASLDHHLGGGVADHQVGEGVGGDVGQGQGQAEGGAHGGNQLGDKEGEQVHVAETVLKKNIGFE